MHVVSGLLFIVGSAFVLIGGIGVLRFGDFMSRTHAAAKAPTLGLILVALGEAVELHTALVIVTMILIVLLQMFTTPVGTHMRTRAGHGEIEVEIDGIDELARDKLRWASQDDPLDEPEGDTPAPGDDGS